MSERRREARRANAAAPAAAARRCALTSPSPLLSSAPRRRSPEHQDYVRALLAVPAGLFACLPKGGFATGGRDKCVRLYA